MKFTKEWLIESLEDGPEVNVHIAIADTSRWSVQYDRVFAFDGKFYFAPYSVGATEYQEESPYEYEPDIIECPEVFPVQKTITVYEPAPKS